MKSVVITGACGGMGSAAVRHFAAHGYRVFALDRKTGAAQDNVVYIEADVTSQESLEKAFETVRSLADEIFAIVHFAGIYMLDSLVEIKSEEYDRIFAVNVKGAYLVNKTFLPLLKSGSRILIITSELAPLDPLPFTGIYAVTKAALEKYAYSLAMELQILGISVSVLRAGAVKTDMLGVSTDYLERFCQNTELYNCNAKRFKRIVEGVETKNIPPQKIAEKAFKICSKKRPAFAFGINRNPLLLILNALPKRFQLFVIKMILK